MVCFFFIIMNCKWSMLCTIVGRHFIHILRELHSTVPLRFLISNLCNRFQIYYKQNHVLNPCIYNTLGDGDYQTMYQHVRIFTFFYV